MENEVKRKVMLFLNQNLQYEKIASMKEQLIEGIMSIAEIAQEMSLMYQMGLLNESLKMSHAQYSKWEVAFCESV